MKRKLERMRNLDGEVVKRLAGANILTVEDLLQHTVVELVQKPNLNLHEPMAIDVMKAVCSVTAYEEHFFVLFFFFFFFPFAGLLSKLFPLLNVFVSLRLALILLIDTCAEVCHLAL
jgi:hypothetical protein